MIHKNSKCMLSRFHLAMRVIFPVIIMGMLSNCQKEPFYKEECLEALFDGCGEVDTALLSNYFIGMIGDHMPICIFDFTVGIGYRSIHPIDSSIKLGGSDTFEGTYGKFLLFMRTDRKNSDNAGDGVLYSFAFVTPQYAVDVPMSEILEDIEWYYTYNDGYLPIGSDYEMNLYKVNINIFSCIIDGEEEKYTISSALYARQLNRRTFADSIQLNHFGEEFFENWYRPNMDGLPKWQNDQYLKWIRVTRFKKEEYEGYIDYTIRLDINLNMYIQNKTSQVRRDFYGPLRGVMQVHFRLKR